MNYKGVMVDIETMATHESKALVVSVAAISFDMKSTYDGPVFEHESFWALLLLPQLLKGRVADPETQRWWGRQSDAAQRMLFRGAEVPIYSFMAQLKEQCEGRDVWANGITFDLCNLVQLADDFGFARPWEYSATRDARTVYRLMPKRRVRDASVDAGLEEHNPVDDCKLQIWKLWECWEFT